MSRVYFRVFVPLAMSCLTAYIACHPNKPVESSVQTSIASASSVVSASVSSSAIVMTQCSLSAHSVDIESKTEDSTTLSFVKEPEQASNVCAVAEGNIQRAMNEILGAQPSAPSEKKVVPWNGKSPLVFEKKVFLRYGVQKKERELLEKNHFVVLPNQQYKSYDDALHDVYQSQLPLYVSADVLFHAIYTSNDKLIALIEQKKLLPLLDSLVGSLHCKFAASASSLPSDVVNDLDVYLGVLRSLLKGQLVLPVHESNQVVIKELLAKIEKASGLEEVSLFGRQRNIDFSQYQPRGHYKNSPALSRFFRAAMWASRLEFNMVSRDCQSSATVKNSEETPREAMAAVALAQLIEGAGVSEKLDQIDKAWSLLAGRREDISPKQLLQLAKNITVQTHDRTAFETLKTAIGSQYRRTTRLHFMPMNAGAELPTIATLLGPRIVVDATATRPLVNPVVGERHELKAADIAYMLGHDKALDFLADDLKTFANLRSQLVVARTIASTNEETPDLYSAWFKAVRALATPSKGALPSFMGTPAFADLRIGQSIAAYAQIKHNFVLMAGQPYDEGGCDIPDGFVDPAIESYEHLIRYTESGLSVMKVLDPSDELKSQEYFTRVSKIIKTLKTIALQQLADLPLTEAQKRFLNMVVEIRPGGTGGPPTYTGWYFSLFREREEALSGSSLIADYYTSGEKQMASYVGVELPRMAVFVVENGGKAKVVAGPVSQSFETHHALQKRLTDDDVNLYLKQEQKKHPWAASYTADIIAEPDLRVTVPGTEEPGLGPFAATLTSTKDIGPVTLEMLDHHGERIFSMTKSVGRKEVQFLIPKKKITQYVQIRVGKFVANRRAHWAGGTFYFGALQPKDSPSSP